VALPPELLLSQEQKAALDAAHEKNRKERETSERAARGLGGDSGSEGSGLSWDVGDGGEVG